MAYSSASDVAGLCRNILGGASNFTTSTSPTLAAVNNWLSSGCALIETALADKGYSMPVPATALVYDQVGNLNSLFGAGHVELSRTNVRLGPGERTRGQQFLEQFRAGLKWLAQMDLTRAGLERESQGKLYAGGISIADRDTVEDDTDRVEPRFKRDMFKRSGVVWPAGTSAS